MGRIEKTSDRIQGGGQVKAIEFLFDSMGEDPDPPAVYHLPSVFCTHQKGFKISVPI